MPDTPNTEGAAGSASPEILFLQQEDVIAAGVLNMARTLEDVERSFRLHGQGEVWLPAKTLMEFPDPQTGLRRYVVVAMPAYVGDEMRRAGIKWASESMDNARRGDLPYGIDLVILHDLEHALPVAIMDGTLITAMRTGAAAGVAAKYLARPDSHVAGLVGAGVIGRTALEAILLSVPSIEEMRLFDLRAEKAEALAAEFDGRAHITVTASARQAVEGADVVVTMTTTREPFLRAEWFKPGSFYAQLGSNEADEATTFQADRLIVDDWEPIKHYQASSLSRLHREGRLTDEDVTNLREIVVGRSPGRTCDEERILFKPLGLGVQDIVVADRIYHEAKAMGLGVRLHLWNQPKWL